MNKSDLIKKISDRTHVLNDNDIDLTINTILNLISESLNIGNRVEIRNFGTFSIRLREQRISRNPRNGTSVLVQAKHHPYFRASKYLKESFGRQ